MAVGAMGGAGGADEATSAEDASYWRVGGTADLVQTRLEEWEAGRSHREVTQEEGPSRRQKVQGALAKPPVLGSQHRQAVRPLLCTPDLVSWEVGVMYPLSR